MEGRSCSVGKEDESDVGSWVGLWDAEGTAVVRVAFVDDATDGTWEFWSDGRFVSDATDGTWEF